MRPVWIGILIILLVSISSGVAVPCHVEGEGSSLTLIPNLCNNQISGMVGNTDMPFMNGDLSGFVPFHFEGPYESLDPVFNSFLIISQKDHPPRGLITIEYLHL